MERLGSQDEIPGGGTVAAVVIVIVAAALLRLYDLASLPPAHYRDVALTALDALRAAAGDPRVHYTYDEGLYSNIMGLLFMAAGASDWTVRLPGALFGVLTCWGVYRLGRALGLGRAAVYAAALLAVSFWHLLLSRSGFRVILLPLLLVLSVTLVIESLESLEGRKRSSGWRMAAAGALFGLGLHVYPAARIAPLILPGYLFATLGRDRSAWRSAARGLLWFAAGAVLVAAPLLLHYVEHPEHAGFSHRLVSIFSPGVTAGEAYGHLQRNLFATLAMFHLRGDANWRHNIAGSPMLDPATGILLLVGLLATVGRWFTPAGALLLAWLPVMLLPNLLSIEGVPHGLRSCAALPALMLLSGIGLAALERIVARRGGARVAAVAAALLLVVVGAGTSYRYFVVWGGEPRVVAAHDGGYRSAARTLMSAPAGTARILVANGTGFPAYGRPAEAHPFLFEMRDAPPIVVLPRDGERLALHGRPAYIALLYPSDEAVALIRRLNPGARVLRLADPGLSPGAPVYSVD